MDIDYFKKIPKVEIHNHLEGTITPETLNTACAAKAGQMGDGGVGIRNLLAEFGANGLMELKVERYTEFKTKMEAL